MSLVGKIQSLFLDREKTQPIFPITKVKAVSDDNGKGLNVLLDDKASKDFVTAKIAEAQLGGGSGGVDLSGFATKDDLNAVNDKIPTTPEQIGAHPNTWLPTIAQIGAAPAGYGLGTTSWLAGGNTRFDNAAALDELRVNGFWAYQKAGSPLESNYTQTQFVAGYTISNSSSFVTQRAVTLYTGIWIERQLVTRQGVAAWEPWSYINPPLELGIEYRTTERWNGKVVYTKLIDFGALPNTTEKTVGHGVYPMGLPLSVTVAAKKDNWSFTLPSDHSVETKVLFNAQGVTVATTLDRSDYNAYATLKYTKD